VESLSVRLKNQNRAAARDFGKKPSVVSLQPKNHVSRFQTDALE
jgi:hypothetical protein